MSISLASVRAQTATLDEVTALGTITLRRDLETYGYDQMLRVVNHIVQEADIALGGDGDPSRCVPAAANALVSNGHRGIGFLVVAIREGMKRTDKDGKAFGKINATLLNEWTSAQEGLIIGMRENEHSQVSFKNDNVGADYMERLQYEATSKDRKIAGMAENIERLKAKLSNEKAD